MVIIVHVPDRRWLLILKHCRTMLNVLGLFAYSRTMWDSIWIHYSHVLHGVISTVVCHSKGTRGQFCQCLSEVALCLWCWCAWRHNTMVSYHTPESILSKAKVVDQRSKSPISNKKYVGVCTPSLSNDMHLGCLYNM